VDPSGKAVVTGASRGIGRAVAIELAARGFDVTATMRRPSDGSPFEHDTTGRIRVARLDVTKPETIELPRGLRVLVNNAALEGAHLPLEGSSTAKWREVFETNVFGPAEVTRQAIPLMRDAGGGVICNITTSAVLIPIPLYSAYRASKAAVSALGESLRIELAPMGIRVIEIIPGPIDTEMFHASGPAPEALASEHYKSLADFIADQVRQATPYITSPVEAARAIVDAILDDGGPLRYGCDPLGADMVSAWRKSSDTEQLDAMSAGYAAFVQSSAT